MKQSETMAKTKEESKGRAEAPIGDWISQNLKIIPLLLLTPSKVIFPLFY